MEKFYYKYVVPIKEYFLNLFQEMDKKDPYDLELQC